MTFMIIARIFAAILAKLGILKLGGCDDSTSTECICTESQLRTAIHGAAADGASLLLCAGADIRVLPPSIDDGLLAGISVNDKNLTFQCDDDNAPAPVFFGLIQPSSECKLNGAGKSRILVGNPVRLVFENISFENGSAGGSSGGAAWLSSGNVAFKSCSFTNNKAGEAGGAIYADGGANMTLTVSDCTFTGNSAYGGGAIYLDNGVHLIGKGNHFIANKVGEDGGAVECKGSTATIENTIFERNHAADDGGALRSSECDINLSDCTFTKNTAKDDGNDIYIEDDKDPVNGTGTFVMCADKVFFCDGLGGIHERPDKPELAGPTDAEDFSNTNCDKDGVLCV